MDPSTTAPEPPSPSAPGRLALIRHGQTEWSATGRHTGVSDIPLRPDGEQNARDLRADLAALHADRVVTSPRRRAIETARLAGFEATETDPDLGEWDYGALEGMTRAEIRRVVPDWTIWTHTPPGGESVAEVSIRADRFLAGAEADLQAGRTVIAFSHGHFSRVLMVRWIGLPITSGALFTLDPGRVSLLGEDRGQRVVNRWNAPPAVSKNQQGDS